MSGLSEWNSTRQSLSRLQASVENRIVHFNKLVKGVEDSVRPTGGISSINSKPAGLQNQLAVAVDVKMEVENVLKDANHLIGRLNSLASNPTHLAQVRRFREIFDGCSREFARAGHRFDGCHKHISLTESRSSKPADVDDVEVQLMRERSAIDSSISMLEETIASGQRAHKQLRSQRQRFTDIASKAARLTSQLPSVNYLMGSIKRVNVKQQIILAATVGFCLLFMLVYAFRR